MSIPTSESAARKDIEEIRIGRGLGDVSGRRSHFVQDLERALSVYVRVAKMMRIL